jgi:hypothetical protein
MITHNVVYWATRVDGIKAFLCVMSSIAIILGIIISFIGLAADGRANVTYLKHLKYTVSSIILGLFIAFVNALVPTKKDVAAIVIIPPLANGIMKNEDIKALPGEFVGLVRDWVAELRPEKVKAERSK